MNKSQITNLEGDETKECTLADFPVVHTTQSTLSEELLSKLDKRSRAELRDLLSDIEFLRNLTNPGRKRARDLEKDDQGRIIVDVTNPHILEGMSFFTERANFFRENRRYTDIFPNPAPGSEYRKFWDEERRRCREGLVRPDDGEWVTGYHYFYLNYSPILKIEELDEDGFLDLDENIRADRVEDFPSLWDSDYFFFHYIEQAQDSGEHANILKTRGSGQSFKFGGMCARNYFLFDSSKSFAFASDTEYLIRDGVLTKAWSIINFIDNNTPFTQPRDYKDTDMHKRASYKDVKSKTERGMLSEIIGVTCKNDPSKGRGKRGKLLAFDESGIFPGLKKVWRVARKSVEQGRYVFGLMVAAGTGGEEGSNFEAAESFFYAPGAYNIKELKNVYDKVHSASISSMFVGGYMNVQGCYDENGNSDIVRALVQILLRRQKIRRKSDDPNDLVQERAETPITPQEAVLRVEGSLFPIQDLKDHLSEISVNQDKFLRSHYVGRFKASMEGKTDFVLNTSLVPVREFPIKDNLNKVGAVEIFEHPVRLSDGRVPRLRYIMGIDPYDDDHSTTTSLGSAFVLDRFTDRIVAEYTGRPALANEFYEMCLRMARYYNAIINYENDKKGLYAYFFNKNCLHYLCDNPEILSEKDLVKIHNNYGNKKKGTNSSTAVNAWARRLQADWLISNAYGTGGVDDEGNDIPPLMNLQQVRSIGYLKELIAWHPDLENADRVSAMGMLMILRADMERLDKQGTREDRPEILKDPFFGRKGNRWPRVPSQFSHSYSGAN